MSITHTRTPVLQYNEYYPFGLQTMNSWTRENNSNNFLYNEGTELNTTTGLYDLAYRNYDPVLGRFGQVDPMADYYGSQTPYNYANNDPVYFNDPMGLSSQGGCNWCGGAAKPYMPKFNDGGGGGGAGGDYGVVFTQATGGYFNRAFGDGYGSAGLNDEAFAQADAYHGDPAELTKKARGLETSFWNEINELSQTLPDGNTPILSPVTIEETRINPSFLQERIDNYYQDQIASGPDLLDRLWNSDLARLIVPDVLTLDGNYVAVLGIGSSQTYTLNLITRGSDAGLHKTTTMQQAYGGEWGYGLNVGYLQYQGPVSNLSVQTLLGPSRTISFGVVDGLNVNAGYGDWSDSVLKPSLIGLSGGIGIVIGGSYGVGETRKGWWPFTPRIGK